LIHLSILVQCTSPVTAGEYVFNHRNDSLREWFMTNYFFGPTAMDSPFVNGFYVSRVFSPVTTHIVAPLLSVTTPRTSQGASSVREACRIIVPHRLTMIGLHLAPLRWIRTPLRKWACPQLMCLQCT
jgi:hypothetical protein